MSQEFKKWLVDAGVKFESLNMDKRIEYKLLFDNFQIAAQSQRVSHKSDPILMQKIDSIQNLLMKKAKDPRKLISGSQCSNTDFAAFGIFGLPFNSVTWRDCQNIEVLDAVNKLLDNYLQVIADDRASIEPTISDVHVNKGITASEAVPDRTCGQRSSQSITPMKKASNRTRTVDKPPAHQTKYVSSPLLSSSASGPARVPTNATFYMGKATNTPQKASAVSRPHHSTPREYERRFVHPASQKLLTELVRFKFPQLYDKSVFIQTERKYGPVENSVSIINEGTMDRAVVFQPMCSQDQGFCLGPWEDKSFLENILHLPHISQLCAQVIAEETKLQKVLRYPKEVCGVLTNGEKFIIFRRRSGAVPGERVNHYFLCETREEMAIGLAHFLAVCEDNLAILMDSEFDVVEGINHLSTEISDKGGDDKDRSNKDQDEDQVVDPSHKSSESVQLKPHNASTSSSVRYSTKNNSRSLLREYYDHVPMPRLTADNLALVGSVR